MKRDGFVKEREPDTIIYDRQGWSNPGYTCGKHCTACPYLVEDCMGEDACYAGTYERCDRNE